MHMLHRPELAETALKSKRPRTFLSHMEVLICSLAGLSLTHY